MNHKRILWLTKGLDVGGAEVLLYELATSQPLKIFEVEIAAVLKNRLQMRAQFEEAGILVRDLGATSSRDVRWLWRLLRLLRNGNYAVVHAHSPLPASFGRLLSVLLNPRPKFVTTEHSHADVYHPVTRWLNWLTSPFDDERFAVSKAAAVTPRWLRRKSTRVVYHGRKPVRFPGRTREDVRRDFGWDDDFVVLCVANMRPEKNLSLLVRAFAKAFVGDRAKLVMVGDGVQREMLESLSARLGVINQVEFLGHRSDARRLMTAADAIALSSHGEGLPVSVVEAMQAGLPVVATRVGGLPELVRHGLDGLLVPAGSTQALARALREVGTNGGLRSRMSHSAAARGENFSIDASAEAMRRAYCDA